MFGGQIPIEVEVEDMSDKLFQKPKGIVNVLSLNNSICSDPLKV